ncbi:serine/threonine protein phosphatase 1 [Dyella sp. SG562]|uniref:metallophosphoesterase n=1 Tax=Dyella sp. SG562 TaxID=2587017 RepID=UPI00141F4EAB|nr:metallophosphoesterase [Dyella sp. SG562]NII73930.1 serine/threonine protein phosphatase 1 [Dyella sp. SG562]
MSFTASPVRRFSRNKNGRDFVVGDIHGCFDKLRDAMVKVSFDEAKDRLFSVGDLVDRGPSSEEAIDWIAKPWFHAVRGNHEQMAIGVASGRHDLMNYVGNGGAWFLEISEDRQKQFAEVFDILPYAIEIDSAVGRVGIVHADIGGDSWDEFVTEITGADSNNKRRRISEVCLWSRSRVQAFQGGYAMAPIRDLAQLIVGHTPMKVDTWLANVHYIDTGAVYGRELTMVELSP